MKERESYKWPADMVAADMLRQMPSCREVERTEGRYFVTGSGDVLSNFTRKGVRLLRPMIDPDGYPFVSIKGVRYYVHVLVLRAFKGPSPAGMESLHGNGNPADPCIENLRWGTRAENVADAMRHGTAQAGERHYFAKLDANAVRAIRVLRNRYRRNDGIVGFLARWFGVSYSTISDVWAGRTWRTVA